MNLLRKLIGISIFICAMPLCAAPVPTKVFISQVVEHSALDATSRGIVAGLAESGFKVGENLEVRLESAQSSTAMAAQIASKYVNQHPDIVVGVGTVSAQSFAKYAREDKVKLIFSSVTDPKGSGLVKCVLLPSNNTSGVSNFVPLEPQLVLMQKMQPQLHTLGILYNPGEANSVYIVKNLESLCKKNNIILIKQSVTKTSEVAQAALKLANQVDAIFVSNDNTVLSAIQSVILSTNKRSIPVYVSDTDVVPLGALAALGPNQFAVGEQTGRMIARILRGENINDMPVEFPQKTDLYINLDAAEKAKIHIPHELISEAAVVVEGKRP